MPEGEPVAWSRFDFPAVGERCALGDHGEGAGAACAEGAGGGLLDDHWRARPSVAALWPPTHKLVPVTILGVGDGGGNGGPVVISILGITQNEPLNGQGDGDTAPDAVIQGSTVLLRAERAGIGAGRVYRITFRATNAGGSCTGVVTVSVPHDQNTRCIDNGLVYDSLGH